MRLLLWASALVLVAGAACGQLGDPPPALGSGSLSADGPGRGFPEGESWATYHGAAAEADLARLAASFRILNIDADPSLGSFTAAQVAAPKAGGRNRVISYLNLGACESFRSYFREVPAGFLSCGSNIAAQLGPYAGYPEETWMNPANPEYQRLIAEYVAPRLVAQGVDGLLLDNMEIVEHGTETANGPCDAACAQGGLDLVRHLREALPDHLIVINGGAAT